MSVDRYLLKNILPFIWYFIHFFVSLKREIKCIVMYKSRAIPTLSGENAEYFREIQEEMEHTESHEKWQSVGEGVKAMMQRADKEAWAI